MLDFDQAIVQLQAGSIDPPPVWVMVVRRAKWLGVAPWDLIEQDECWSAWVDLLMQIDVEKQQQEKDLRDLQGA